jgi:tetratricopeptide (TPR) repeat protein
MVRRWHRREAENAERQENWFTAFFYLDRLLAAGPQDGALLRRRGLAQAWLGRAERSDADYDRAEKLGAMTWRDWDERGRACAATGRLDRAAVCFRRATELGADGWQTWRRCALACLAADDAAGYRAACAGMLDRFGRTDDWQTADRTAWTCCVAEIGPDNAKRAAALSEKAAAAEVEMLWSPAAAAYRAGKPEKTIEQLREAVEAGGRAIAIRDWLFLALAHVQQGRPKDAAECLARVAPAIERAKSWSWDERLEFDLLHREVEGALKAAVKP